MKSRLWKPPALPVAAVPFVPPQPAVTRNNGLFAALDLGTNNCRLLIARPAADGFRVVDSFSRIVRLGEGLAATGALSKAAMDRTRDALFACAQRLKERDVTRVRLVATEACRSASNGAAFLEQVTAETGLSLEIIDRQTEAELAAAGCAVLMAPDAAAALMFDIGGGSTEIVALAAAREAHQSINSRIKSWASLPVGVVTLSEQHGAREVDAARYEAMVTVVDRQLGDFAARNTHLSQSEGFHLLGTSGTVTTVAAVHLGLPRYDRRAVDALWMQSADADQVIRRIRALSYAQRVAHPCIGAERADLVLAGCAIYDAIARRFPARRLRIADRGLREGILMQLMMADGVWRVSRGQGE